MSNLAQTQANWNKLFREHGIFLGPSKRLKDVERSFDTTRLRIQVKEENDVNAFTSGWVLSGVKFGTNTDENGVVFVRIQNNTPGAGQATISLYTAVGASGLVAQGVVTYPATCTLTQQNASGLSGTVVVGTVTASESNDLHYLRLYPDWPVRATAVLDGSQPEHGAMLAQYLAACNSSRQLIRQARNVWKAAFEAVLAGRGANFLGSGNTTPINKGVTVTNGAVTTVNAGILEDLRKDMVDEATAGAQKVVKNTVSAGAGVFDSGNQGKGTLSAPTVEEYAVDGLTTAVCVDATLGSEEFQVFQRLTNTGEIRKAQNNIRVNKAFADPTIGIRSAMLVRTLTLDTGIANDFGTASQWSISGETSSNTNNGVIYLKVVDGGGSTFKIQGFTSSTYSAGTQVFDSTNVAANNNITLSQVNNSGITGTGRVGASPTLNNTGTLNLNVFVTQNSSGVPDKFTVAITAANASRGEIQDLVGELEGYYLNSATLGSQTINEGFVAAGTFPPFEIRDA